MASDLESQGHVHMSKLHGIVSIYPESHFFLLMAIGEHVARRYDLIFNVRPLKLLVCNEFTSTIHLMVKSVSII